MILFKNKEQPPGKGYRLFNFYADGHDSFYIPHRRSQNMKKILILFFVMLGLLACDDDDNDSRSCIDPSKIKDVVACPQVVDPVCGCNHQTYQNECIAEGSGVTSWTKGACP